MKKRGWIIMTGMGVLIFILFAVPVINAANIREAQQERRVAFIKDNERFLTRELKHADRRVVHVKYCLGNIRLSSSNPFISFSNNMMTFKIKLQRCGETKWQTRKITLTVDGDVNHPKVLDGVQSNAGVSW